ncbi:O-succinylbenzoate synthase, partial [Actinotignum timonense]|nr:O-succinylbenzoate synthase [Actinotignum timonense]
MIVRRPPRPLRSHIPVNVTIPVTSPQDAARLVRGAAGCTTAKVKVADPRSTLRDIAGDVTELGGTLDDAAGEAFDKV